MDKPSQESIDFYKKMYENVNDDEYIAVAERNDRIRCLVRALNSNPGLMSNIKALMEYRDLRTQQVWLPNLINELYEDPDVGHLTIDSLRETVQRLDRDRRTAHNKALGNFCGMVNYMKSRGMDYFYRGKLMDPNYEPDDYGDPNIRQEMTDFFLNSLYELEEMNLADLQQEHGEQLPNGVASLKQIRSELAKSSRDYDVREPLKEDDGNIIFYN